MTEDEYKQIDDKMNAASELRAKLYKARESLEWFDKDFLPHIKDDDFIVIASWSGYGNVHIPLNEKSEHFIQSLREMLEQNVKSAEKEWEEFKVCLV